MKAKLAELFQKKYLWEDKRDNLYNQILWDHQQNALWFLSIAIYLFSLCLGKSTIFKWESGNKLPVVIWIILISISLSFWWFSLVRNIFNVYYKLPRYRRKINEIDHQIIEELKNSNII